MATIRPLYAEDLNLDKAGKLSTHSSDDDVWVDQASEAYVDDAVDAITVADLDTLDEAGIRSVAAGYASDALNDAKDYTDTAVEDLVATDDSRLSDSRTPSGGAGGALSGSYPNPGLNTESVQDLIAAFAQAGTGVSIDYDDTLGTLTFSVSDLAITDVFTVASQSAMLALTAQKGDVAVRSDISETFILAASPAGTLSNWVLLPTPTDTVLSVNGNTGAVTITLASLGGVPTTRTVNGKALSSNISLDSSDVGADPAGTAATAVGAIPSGGSGATPALRALGTSGTTAAAGNDSRLSDARTPTGHAASHADGGADELTLSQSQIVDLNDDLDTIRNSLDSLDSALVGVDVTSDPPDNDDILAYDATSQLWTPATLSASSLGLGTGAYADTLSRTAVKTSAYTAQANELVPVDTTSGSVTITLPNAPTDHCVVAIKHIIQGGTYLVTVACAGSDKFNRTGGATSFTLPLLAQGVILHYELSANVWTILADDIPLSQLDIRFTLESNRPKVIAGQDEGSTITVGAAALSVLDAPFALPTSPATGTIYDFDIAGILVQNDSTTRVWTWTILLGSTTMLTLATATIANNSQSRQWRVRGRIRVEGTSDQNAVANLDVGGIGSSVVGLWAMRADGVATENMSTAKAIDLKVLTASAGGTQTATVQSASVIEVKP